MSAAPDLIDPMGCWTEDMDTAWLPRAYYPTRGRARQAFDVQTGPWGNDWPRIRVLARYVRLDPYRHPDEGQYVECARDEPGATPVWRCEEPSA